MAKFQQTSALNGVERNFNDVNLLVARSQQTGLDHSEFHGWSPKFLNLAQDQCSGHLKCKGGCCQKIELNHGTCCNHETHPCCPNEVCVCVCVVCVCVCVWCVCVCVCVRVCA